MLARIEKRRAADDSESRYTEKTIAPIPEWLTRMEDITNFYQITKDIGTGGQPTVSQLSEVAQNNYSVVVNLAMPDSAHAIPQEESIVASLGMQYIHIPIPFEAPTANHLREFLNVMESCQNKKVFVHCVVNARVSAFVYKYLTLKKGFSPEEASTPLLVQWLPTMDSNWKAVMDLEIEEIDAK